MPGRVALKVREGRLLERRAKLKPQDLEGTQWLAADIGAYNADLQSFHAQAVKLDPNYERIPLETAPSASAAPSPASAGEKTKKATLDPR